MSIALSALIGHLRQRSPAAGWTTAPVLDATEPTTRHRRRSRREYVLVHPFGGASARTGFRPPFGCLRARARGAVNEGAGRGRSAATGRQAEVEDALGDDHRGAGHLDPCRPGRSVMTQASAGHVDGVRDAGLR